MQEIRFTADELATFREEIGKPIWKEELHRRYGDRIPAQELLTSCSPKLPRQAADCTRMRGDQLVAP